MKKIDPDLQTWLHYLIQFIDFTVYFGVRTAEKQFSLYKQGRKKVGDAWVIVDKKKVVTYKDGYIRKSKHQSGEAVDIIYYHKTVPHLVWKDTKANMYLAGMGVGTAKVLKKYGAIDKDIVNGADWDGDGDLYDQTFFDVYHFQV